MMKKHNQTSDDKKRIFSSPKKLSFELIKLITNDFSEELGRGAFGQVFKVKLTKHEDHRCVYACMWTIQMVLNNSYLFTYFVCFKSNPIRAYELCMCNYI
jgi:hypothetical protein